MKRGRIILFLLIVVSGFLIADMQYDAYMNGGKIDYKDGRYERAYEQFSKAVERKPDDPMARYWLGLVSSKLEKYEEAVENFEKAFELKPELINKLADKPTEKNTVVQAYISVGEARLNQQNYEEAIKFTERAYELDKENTALLTRLSNLYFNTGDTTKLREVGERLVKENEDNPEGFFILGKYYISVQNLDKADENITKAVELYERDFDKIIEKLKELGISTDKEAFIQFIRRINQARINGESMENIRNMVMEEFSISERKANQIMNLIGIASTTSFKIKEAYVWLSKIKLNKADYKDAIEISKKALEFDPEDPEVLYSLGESYFFVAENLKFKLDSLKLNKEEREKKEKEIKDYYKKTIEIFSKIKENYPDDSHIRVLMGASYIELDKIDDAINILEEAKSIDPDNLYIYNNLAVCYQKKGDNKKLQEVLKKLKELEKK